MNNHRKTPAEVTNADVNRRIVADHGLQLEISRSLEGLTELLPNLSDLRLVSAVHAVLRPSWTQHSSFQDKVLFPILVRQHDSPELSQAFEKLREDHTEIAKLNRKLDAYLARLLERRGVSTKALESRLISTIEARQRHFESELAALASAPLLPLAPPDGNLMQAWIAAQPDPGFPLRLLLGFRS